VQDDLADRIVTDAIEAARVGDLERRSARSTVLPLLEFTLTELWERREDGWLTHHAYDQIGGVIGGLGQWCDRALQSLEPELRPVARRVVTALVSIGDESEGVPDSRRRRSIVELAAGDEDAVGEVVQRLTAARLLVTSRRDEDGQASVELIHEALLREWPLLQQWLAEDRDFLAWRQRIERPTAVWTASSTSDDALGDEDLLLRGRQLSEAEDWLDQRGPELPTDQVAYVKASQNLQTRDRNRDRRRIRILTSLTVGLVVLLLVAVTAGLFAMNRARLAQARALAALATAKVATEPDLAQLLSLESLRTVNTIQGRESLLGGLLAPDHEINRLLGHTTTVVGVAFSPDGTRIATASADRTVRLWDAATGKQIGQPLTGHTDQVYGVAFSPDGTRIASASADRTVRLWDTATGKQIGQPLHGHTNALWGGVQP
jgi:hypothetical protein